MCVPTYIYVCMYIHTCVLTYVHGRGICVASPLCTCVHLQYISMHVHICTVYILGCVHMYRERI